MLKNFFDLSILKTIQLNWHYFGLKGVLHCYILAAHNLDILRLKGKIIFLKEPHFGIVKIGFPHTGIFDKKYERAIWDNVGEIKIGGDVRLYQGARISNSGIIVFLGGFSMGSSTIVCEKEIVFGNGVLVSWDDLIMDSDFHKIYDAQEMKRVVNNPQKILIGEHTWIGCRSTILKGTRLANNTIVAACSCISGEISRENLVVGDKKKILKENIIWKD